MTVTAGAVALVILFGAPAIYFTMAYEYAHGAVDTQADVSARAVERLVVVNPGLWRYEQVRLEELLARRSSDREPEVRRVLDAAGDVVAESVDALEPPVVTSRAPIYDAGLVVARTEVSRSLRPVLVRTGGVLGVALLFTALVFTALRVVPLRAVKRAYAWLEESERRYRSLYDSTRDGIALHRVVRGVDGAAVRSTVVDVNPPFARLAGVDASALVGADGAALLDGALAPWLPRMWRVADGDAPFELEVHVPDGARTLRVWVSSPQDGHFATMVSDETEQRRAEALQAQLEEQLQRSQRMESLGRLAGGVAHDLNNLLAPILTYASLLAEAAPPGSEQAADLAEIEASAVRARDLVRQLLASGRRLVLDMRTADLREALANLEKLLRRTLREDVRLELRVPPALGLVRADVGQIEQVILNLAVNAQHAMPDGGALVIALRDLETRGEDADRQRGVPPGAWVELSVRDTGCGIDPALLGRIFEPFFTTRRQGEGTGLGLAIVHGIVTQHGGHVVADSEPGRGTTFRILLPRLAAGTVDAPRLPAPAAVGGTGTVLLAEDEPGVRAATTRILDRLGYRVISAASGAECLALAAREAGPIGLLLTDVIMTDMNGRQLHEQLAAIRPGVPVLYMSGYAGDVIGRHGVLDAGTAFVQKPFTPSDLAAAVRAALEGDGAATG